MTVTELGQMPRVVKWVTFYIASEKWQARPHWKKKSLWELHQLTVSWVQKDRVSLEAQEEFISHQDEEAGWSRISPTLGILANMNVSHDLLHRWRFTKYCLGVMKELIPSWIVCFSGIGLKMIPFKDQKLIPQSVRETKWDGRNQPGSVVQECALKPGTTTLQRCSSRLGAGTHRASVYSIRN